MAQSTHLYVVDSSALLSIYNVSDWGLNDSFSVAEAGAPDSGPLSSVEVSPNGLWFLINGQAGSAVYSMTGTLLWNHANTNGSDASFSPDSTMLVYEKDNNDPEVILTSDWSTVVQSWTDVLSTGGGPLVTAWSHDGTKLAFASSNSNGLQIFETTGWTAYSNLLIFTGNRSTKNMEFSYSDTVLACAQSDFTADNTITVMTVQPTLVDGDLLLVDDPDSFYSVAWKSDDTRLYAGSFTGAAGGLVVYETAGWTLDSSTAVATKPVALEISDDDTLLATGGNTSPYLSILDATTLLPIAETIPTPASRCFSVGWSREVVAGGPAPDLEHSYFVKYTDKAVDLLDSANSKYDNATSGLAATFVQGAIDEVVASSTAKPTVIVTKVTHGLVSGDALYFDGVDWSKAQANTLTTIGYAVALKIDDDTFHVYTNGLITGLIGLTPGSWYFVSEATAGLLQIAEPISGYSNPLGVAISTTELIVIPMRAGQIDASITEFNNASSTNILASSTAILASAI